MENLQEDWQEQSPAWRQWQIFKCLCDIVNVLETKVNQ